MKPLRADDPRAVGGYRLLGALGSGGMGRVYLARSQGGRNVAVKVIRPEFADNPTFRLRFRREVEAARRVGGPWTAPLVDADPDAEYPYLVTTYIPGPSLTQAVAGRGPLPAPTVRTLGAGLAEALIAIHDTGLVHRDLKPSNVLLSLDGPRVIDFGVSRAIDATVLTHTGAPIGSPAFMSPEQVRGAEAGPASDVFSLGAVLVFAATGAGPFDGPIVAAVMHNVLNREPDLDALPADLRDLVRACLRRVPEARPTPAAVLASLAPDGDAAALVAAGWLPPDLVTSLSRQAVALLDLEAPTGPGLDGSASAPGTSELGSTPDSRSGPTQFVPTHATASPTPQPSASQPPTPQPATPQPSTPWPSTPWPPAPWPPAPQPLTSQPSTPGPSTPWPSTGQPPADRSGPPSGRRNQRRLIALASAGALGLAAIVALIVFLATTPVSSENDGRPPATPDGPSATPGGSTAPGGSDTPTPPPTGSDPPRESATPRPGSLPEGYAGEWAGQVTSQLGIVQDVVITLREGESGQVLGHAEFTLTGLAAALGDVTCVGDLRFVGFGGAGGDEVVLTDVPGSGNNSTVLGFPACTEGGTMRLLLRPDGGLAFASDEDDAGRPTGTLARRS
ncbi:protein kinase [Frankia sp. CNm7]|uniref:Protein kinase n=1 Tax=Frankia nepalensis TaxID=1836974 RepID=A0A937REX9_9ACTN|nr:serine/threonine-protein kinase [Frankia nepalensis]MBL7497508.1 protein kinase [Frankia nepalensis]MBL7510225.1 protein kinase [Frankia nepalensis]MBL7523253.1 protein kinase [Frankia nepalensis]MBL7630936.1 protein kinase [Frankia nepalensis]